MPTKSITPRTTISGRSISPLLGVPPNARVGTTTFTKAVNGAGGEASASRVRSISSQRAVYTIVTGGAVVRTDSTNVAADAASRPGGEADAPPPQVSLRSLSPAFQPLEPGVYSHMPSRAATSRSGSVVATTTITTTTKPAVAVDDKEVPQPSSARASLAPPGYNDALKKSSGASVATRRSASRETGGPLASSRQPLLGSYTGQRRAASSDAKPLPSKEQLNSLRPKQSAAPSSAGVPAVAAKVVVAPRKRSADSLIPRVAAPPMNPSVQPRTYRRSLSTDAVPHMSRGASADRQPLTARQHHPQPAALNVVSSRGKSSDVSKPTKVQHQALRPPSHKVTTAAVARPATTAPTSSSAAHRTASESGDAFTTTVPTATPSTQRNAATTKLDYSDNEWSNPQEKPFAVTPGPTAPFPAGRLAGSVATAAGVAATAAIPDRPARTQRIPATRRTTTITTTAITTTTDIPWVWAACRCRPSPCSAARGTGSAKGAACSSSPVAPSASSAGCLGARPSRRGSLGGMIGYSHSVVLLHRTATMTPAVIRPSLPREPKPCC